jgi:transcriptional regulator with XRE-family HTH domain
VRDIRTILRLTHEHGLSVREVAERLGVGKTTVSTYLLRAREAGLSCWPLPPGHDDDAVLERRLFHRMGRPPQDMSEPDWSTVAREVKRKGVTLTLLWQEYRAAHPDGYGFTWFCERFAAFRQRAHPTFRNRHAAGEVMQCDYAGQTVPVIDPGTGAVMPAQIFVAVLGASSLTPGLRRGQALRPRQRKPEAARLDRCPCARACLLRGCHPVDRLRQSEGGSGQGALVRADAERDLCRLRRAL